MVIDSRIEEAGGDMATSNNSKAVLTEARSWLGTPFHHAQAVKGGGVDCAMFLASVYHLAGIVPWYDPRPYPPDWHLHQDVERFLGEIRKHAHRVKIAKPGDVALYRYGRCVAHGAIIEDGNYIIHAWIIARAVVRTERLTLADRLHSYWRVTP